jgi:hypothetical protein
MRDDDDDEEEEEVEVVLGEQRDSLLCAEFSDRRLLCAVDADEGRFSLKKVK